MPTRSESPSSATPSWARPTPTPGATSAPSTPTRPPVRQQVLVGRDEPARQGGRRPATAGPRRPPTGARSSSATTSTSSTSAPPATSTPRSRSPRSRPASTCWSRSRWPTRSPRPRRWSPRRRPPRERGVRSMVGFNYRRVPALALARELIADGRIGDGPAGAGGVPPGLAGRRRGADDLAAAQGDRRLRGARRPGLARRRPGAVPARRAGHRRPAGTCAPSSPSAPATTGPSRSPSTTPPGRRSSTAVGRGRQRRGQPDGHRPQERPDHRGLRQPRVALLRPRAAQRAARARRPGDGTSGAAAGAGHRGRPPLRRRLVAARPRARLGPHLHLAGRRLPRPRSATGTAPVAVVRRRARGAAGAGRDRGECGSARVPRSTYRRTSEGTDGQALHALHRPVGRPHPRGGGRAGRRLGLRRAGDRRLRRAPRRLAVGRAGYVEGRLEILRAARARAAGRSATTSPARRSATTRSTSGTRRSSATQVWGDGDPGGRARSGPPRR